MIGVLLTFAMLSSTAASCPIERRQNVPIAFFDLTDRETWPSLSP